MSKNINELSTIKRLRLIEGVMPAAKDAPEIIGTLQKMGVPYWDIAKILAGERVGYGETLLNPEDGQSHFVRHCEISVEQDEDNGRYCITIDGRRVKDFFAGVIAGELSLTDPDKLLAENSRLCDLNAEAQEEIRQLRKKIEYQDGLIDKFRISVSRRSK